MTTCHPRRLAVVGSWHQASVVSACFAELGNQVTGIGEDAREVKALNSGQAPVFEPGLDGMIRRNCEAGRLRYSTNYAEGLRHAEFVFLCIDTPVGPDDESNLTPIVKAAEQIARNASGSFVLCVSAQVPIGTCDRLATMVAQVQPQYRIPVVYVPEFLRLGTAIQLFMEADRFVIGADDPDVAARVASLYGPLARPVFLTDVRSAEMGKHASNAFLALSISFINQIADLCERTGADVTQVAQILKLDRRIGPHAFLNAGLGYAGGTLGREIKALHHIGEANGVDTTLLDAIDQVNARRVPALVERIKQFLPDVRGQHVGVLGLTYKPGTSTLRRSSALELIDLLQNEGATVAAFDPLARLEEMAEQPSFEICQDPVAAAEGASALVLVSPWKGMGEFDFSACARVMQRALLFDTGNYLSPSEVHASGMAYVGVGRGTKGGQE